MLRIAVIAGLLAGFALSPRLWVGARLYPLTPVLPFLGVAGAAIFFALVVALVAYSVTPRRFLAPVVCALLIAVAVQDQSRWQPWFYQYVLMLFAIALAGAEREEAARNTCRLIITATYVWSGLAKLNPNFFHYTFPWLTESFARHLPAMAQGPFGYLAYVAPWVECALGVGLLTVRFRRVAVWGAIAMHGVILLTIGPLGENYNAVVWPWNLAMIAFLLILFRSDTPEYREILWGQGFAFQKVVLVVFAVMPVLNFFCLWDDYLSSSLYSGNANSGLIYVDDVALKRLPAVVSDYITADAPNVNALDIDDWSLGELHVPAYAEGRVFRSVARQICQYTENSPSVKLVVQGKFALFNGGRSSVYHCGDLR